MKDFLNVEIQGKVVSRAHSGPKKYLNLENTIKFTNLQALDKLFIKFHKEKKIF